MKNKKLKRIEAKARLGLPISNGEKAYYILHSKIIDVEVVNGSKIKIKDKAILIS